jgi:hypothetical protein
MTTDTLFQHTQEPIATYSIETPAENPRVEEDSQGEFIHDLWEGPFGEGDCAGL